jgi:proton glutamate symport protein
MPPTSAPEPEPAPAPAPSPASPRFKAYTGATLAGLGVGLVAGTIAQTTGNEWLLSLVAVTDPIGKIWTNALRMIALPLVVCILVLAINSVALKGVGRMGGLSIAFFVGLLLLGAVFTLAASPVALSWLSVDDATREALASSGAEPPAAPEGSPSFLDRLSALIPANPFEAAAKGDLLALIGFAALFGLALTRLSPSSRGSMLQAVGAMAEAMFVILGWILFVAPIGVFALGYGMSARTGLAGIGIVFYFVVAVSALLLVFTALLYAVAWIFGGAQPGRFAWALVPAQVVAISTRSSLASLPALLDGAERRLGLPGSTAGFVLPLAVSIFKINRTVSSTFKLLFLAAVYNIPLDATTIAAFVGVAGLLSFSSPGIPSGGAKATLPAYLAAGIPIEGVAILYAVDSVPDIFKTLLNVTGNMTAASLVHRCVRAPAPRPAEAAPEAADPS